MLLLIPACASAMFYSNKTVDITSHDASENIYAAGENINVAGKLQGDIIAAGNIINVSSETEGDIIVAGSRITINNNAEDIRLVGSSITIDSKINGDLVAFGAIINVTNNTEISKNSMITGGTIFFDGKSSGDLELLGSIVYFNGVAENNITVRADDFTLGPNASVKGTLHIISERKKDYSDRGIITLWQKPEKKSFGERLASRATFSLMLIVAGLILIWLFNKFKVDVTEYILSSPLQALGFGALSLILTPVIAILLFFTIIFIPVSLFLIALWLLTLFLCFVFAGLITGRLVLKNKGSEYLSLIIGVVVFEVLTLIPVIGGFLNFAAVLLGFGSLTRTIFLMVKPATKKKGKRK